jgi:hypothetical protein
MGLLLLSPVLGVFALWLTLTNFAAGAVNLLPVAH